MAGPIHRRVEPALFSPLAPWGRGGEEGRRAGGLSIASASRNGEFPLALAGRASGSFVGQAWAGGGVSGGGAAAAGAAAWVAACSHLVMYFLRNTATFSDGWAPTDSQYLIRSGLSRTRSSVFLTIGS